MLKVIEYASKLPRTKKQLEASLINCRKMNAMPKTKKQLDQVRRMGTAPKTKKQLETCRLNGLNQKGRPECGWTRGLTGKNTPHWKGGITPLGNKIRNLLQNKEWIKSVFKRDHYTCQKCKRKSGYLVAHHIISLSILIDNFLNKYSKFNYNIQHLIKLAINYKPFWFLKKGITFCSECHDEFHAKYGKAINTLAQVEEFCNG